MSSGLYASKKKGWTKILEILRRRIARVTYGWCHGSFFSLSLLHHLLIKPRRALPFKFYLYSSLGCETRKVLYRVYCVVLLHRQVPKATSCVALRAVCQSNRRRGRCTNRGAPCPRETPDWALAEEDVWPPRGASCTPTPWACPWAWWGFGKLLPR